MKRSISNIGSVTLFILFISISCTNPVNEVEEPKRIENTLQSVSYFKDTVGYETQRLLDAFNIFNVAIDSIGYPDAGYKLWLIQEDSSEIRFMVEGFWPNQEVYDEIHNHQLYKDAQEQNNEFNWDGLENIEYHRFVRL